MLRQSSFTNNMDIGKENTFQCEEMCFSIMIYTYYNVVL